MRGRIPRAIVIPSFYHTITVTGTGKNSRAYLLIPSDNNRRVTSATTLSMTPGDYIRCGVGQDASYTGQRSSIYLNGKSVATTSTNVPSKSYDYYPTGDATINLSVAANGYIGAIDITEG